MALKPEWSHLRQSYSFIKDDGTENLYHVKNFPDHALLQVGVGLKKARERFLDFLSHHDCRRVLHIGTSGGLVPSLKTGDLVVAEEIAFQDEHLTPDNDEDLSLHGFCQREEIPCHSGKLLSVERALMTREEKKQAALTTQALAVDMESWAIAAICREKNISYLSCRGIFDTCDEDLQTLGDPFDTRGNLQPTRLAVNILKDPKIILKIPELQKRLGLVNRNLARVVAWFFSE